MGYPPPPPPAPPKNILMGEEWMLHAIFKTPELDVDIIQLEKDWWDERFKEETGKYPHFSRLKNQPKCAWGERGSVPHGLKHGYCKSTAEIDALYCSAHKEGLGYNVDRATWEKISPPTNRRVPPR